MIQRPARSRVAPENSQAVDPPAAILKRALKFRVLRPVRRPRLAVGSPAG